MSCVRKTRNTSRCVINPILVPTLIDCRIASRIIIVETAFLTRQNRFGRAHVGEEGSFLSI